MKTNLARACFVSIITVGLLTGANGFAHANSGTDNAAALVNTVDDSMRARFAFKVTRDVDEIADEKNVAFAVSSCERCQTVAVAIQVVMLYVEPTELTTQNLAVALNQQCLSCRTLASAYQFVMTTGGPVHFSEAGSVALDRIRNEAEIAARSAEPIDEIQAEIDVLMDELDVVLENELRASGNAGNVARFENGDSAV